MQIEERLNKLEERIQLIVDESSSDIKTYETEFIIDSDGEALVRTPKISGEIHDIIIEVSGGMDIIDGRVIANTLNIPGRKLINDKSFHGFKFYTLVLPSMTPNGLIVERSFKAPLVDDELEFDFKSLPADQHGRIIILYR